MKAMLRTMVAAAAVWLAAAGASAADGVLIVQKVTIGGAPPQTNQVQIEAHRMRTESVSASGAKQVFVFDGTREVMLMIDDAKKTYSEITKADVEAIGAQMAGAMAQMEQMMKGMSPEDRKRMEAMTKGKLGGAGAAATAKTQYKKVGTDTVGKWTCDKYEGSRDGQKVQELCTVDPKALGFSAADFGVAKDMAAFFQKMLPPGASQMFKQPDLFQIGTPEQGFSGVPVRTVSLSGGQTTTMEMTDVHRQAFSDSIFQAPAGYQKQASPFIGGGRRGRQ